MKERSPGHPLDPIFAEFYENDLRSDYKSPIKRVMHVSDLLYMFHKQVNVLKRPEVWDDPFESQVLKADIELQGTTLSDHFRPIRDRIFAQCWTENGENDSLWRIYAPHKQGVLISTTPHKLHASLEHASRILARAGSVAFVNRVIYKSQTRVDDLYRNLDPQELRHPQDMVSLFPTILLKRDSFYHEKEVRGFMLFDMETDPPPTNILEYSEDPQCLIESIIFDPRMPTEKFDLYASLLEKTFHFKDKIGRSDLYSFSNHVISKPAPAERS